MGNSKKSMRTVFFCALYCFFGSCAIFSYLPVFTYLPDYFGMSLVGISFGLSVCAVINILTGLIAAKVIKKLGSSLCLKIGSIFVIVYALLLAFVPCEATYYTAFIFVGLWQGFSDIPTIGDVLYNEYGTDSGKYMSIIIGTSLLGCGLGQGLCGIIYVNVGIESYYLYQVCGSALIMTICGFSIKVSKANETTVEIEETQIETNQVKRSSIFKNPAAWLVWIAHIFIVAITHPFGGYATAYFPSHGMSIALASTILSIGGICSGVFNLFIGFKAISKLGLKKFIYLVCICAILINVMLFTYGVFPSILVIVLILMVYSVGCTVLSLYGILAPAYFKDDSTEVSAISNAFIGISNMVFPPIFASLFTRGGINSLFILATIMAVVVFICLALAMKLQERNGVL